MEWIKLSKDYCLICCGKEFVETDGYKAVERAVLAVSSIKEEAAGPVIREGGDKKK